MFSSISAKTPESAENGREMEALQGAIAIVTCITTVGTNSPSFIGEFSRRCGVLEAVKVYVKLCR